MGKGAWSAAVAALAIGGTGCVAPGPYRAELAALEPQRAAILAGAPARTPSGMRVDRFQDTDYLRVIAPPGVVNVLCYHPSGYLDDGQRQAWDTAFCGCVIHDNYDPSREGTRCVYGYWTFPEPDGLLPNRAGDAVRGGRIKAELQTALETVLNRIGSQGLNVAQDHETGKDWPWVTEAEAVLAKARRSK